MVGGGIPLTPPFGLQVPPNAYRLKSCTRTSGRQTILIETLTYSKQCGCGSRSMADRNGYGEPRRVPKACRRCPYSLTIKTDGPPLKANNPISETNESVPVNTWTHFRKQMGAPLMANGLTSERYNVMKRWELGWTCGRYPFVAKSSGMAPPPWDAGNE